MENIDYNILMAEKVRLLTKDNYALRLALEPFAKKTGIRSGTVVLMKKEVVNARKALGWVDPLSHDGRDRG